MADINAYRATTPHHLGTELGRRLARVRLARNITQKALARDAGVGLRTLRRLEKGQSSTLDTFLRVAIALDLTGELLSALPSQTISPIERLSSRRPERKRARPAQSAVPDEPWSWGDDSSD